MGMHFDLLQILFRQKIANQSNPDIKQAGCTNKQVCQCYMENQSLYIGLHETSLCLTDDC